MFVTAARSRAGSRSLNAPTRAHGAARGYLRRSPPTPRAAHHRAHAFHAAGKSILFATITRGFAAVCAISARSSALSALERSSTSTMSDATSRAPTAPRNALDLDRIRRRLADAGGIDERHRDALDVDRLGEQIARRARECRSRSRGWRRRAALKRLDLPAFGRPAIVTCSPSRIRRPAPRCRNQRRQSIA